MVSRWPPAGSRRRTITTKSEGLLASDYDIKDIGLAPEGVLRIEWADMHMPVLKAIREVLADMNVTDLAPLEG